MYSIRHYLYVISILSILYHPKEIYGLSERNKHGPEKHGTVVKLTDLNFDLHVNSSSPPWMITVSAPWCPACVEMEHAWKKMAEEIRKDGILTGKIDGTKERALMSRLGIRHFPTILRIHGYEMREYVGGRSKQALVAFARQNWKNVQPTTGCGVPTTLCGRMLGEMYTVPARMKALYSVLKHEKSFSDTTILGLAVSIPVTLGLITVCLLDAYVRSIPLQYNEHVHQD